ncbi:MAG: 50S ribosomal protein L33 [Candidatus Omnitrophica bacterium]|nr:50S ribosomal protein L33 [Candidatus Omnitrophota bacterium]
MREIITLECTVCKNRNYTDTKNKKQHQDKLETSKYCKFCHKHTSHKEIK